MDQSPRPRRSSRLASLDNVEPSPAKRDRAARADSDDDDDDARSASAAGAEAAGEAAGGAAGSGAAAGEARSSPPRKRRCGVGAWAAEFSAEGRSEFDRLRTHFRDEIDAHRYAVKEPDGTLTEG